MNEGLHVYRSVCHCDCIVKEYNYSYKCVFFFPYGVNGDMMRVQDRRSNDRGSMRNQKRSEIVSEHGGVGDGCVKMIFLKFSCVHGNVYMLYMQCKCA